MDTKQIIDQIRDIIEKECLYLSTLPEDVITERFNNQHRSIRCWSDIWWTRRATTINA